MRVRRAWAWACLGLGLGPGSWAWALGLGPWALGNLPGKTLLGPGHPVSQSSSELVA